MNGEKDKEQPLLDRPQSQSRPEPDLDIPKATDEEHRPNIRSKESHLAKSILKTLYSHHIKQPKVYFWGAWLLGNKFKHVMGHGRGKIFARYSKKRIQKTVHFLGKIGLVQVKKHPDPNKTYPEEKHIKPGAQRIALFSKMVSVNRMYLTKLGYLAFKLEIPIYLSNPDETLKLLHDKTETIKQGRKKTWQKLEANLNKFPDPKESYKGYSEKLREDPKEPYKRATTMKSHKKIGPAPKEPYKDSAIPLFSNDNEGVARLYGSLYYNNIESDKKDRSHCVDGSQTDAIHQHKGIPLREPAPGSLPSGDASLQPHNNKPDERSIELEKVLVRRNKRHEDYIASQLAKGRTEEQSHREMLNIYEGKRRKP